MRWRLQVELAVQLCSPRQFIQLSSIKASHPRRLVSAIPRQTTASCPHRCSAQRARAPVRRAPSIEADTCEVDGLRGRQRPVRQRGQQRGVHAAREQDQDARGRQLSLFSGATARSRLPPSITVARSRDAYGRAALLHAAAAHRHGVREKVVNVRSGRLQGRLVVGAARACGVRGASVCAQVVPQWVGPCMPLHCRVRRACGTQAQAVQPGRQLLRRRTPRRVLRRAAEGRRTETRIPRSWRSLCAHLP